MKKSTLILPVLSFISLFAIAAPSASIAAAQDQSAAAESLFNPNFALLETSYKMPSGHTLEYLRPEGFHETVIAADQITAVSYTDESGRVLITITENLLDDKAFAELMSGENFKNGELAKFSDKEHLLWGQYEILEDAKTESSASLALKGFLKKPEDAYLPDQHNFLYQRSILEPGVLVKVTCQVQGSQAMAVSSKMLFEVIEDKFAEIASSLKLKD